MSASFNMTLAALGSAFSVKDIATFDLVTIPEDSRLDIWFSYTQYAGFDFFPVSNKTGVIVGVVCRSQSDRDCTAAQVMINLDDSILVASCASLLTALNKLDDKEFLLIVDGIHISGILTKADVQKLPVRLYAFTVITYLESLMATVVECSNSEPGTWINRLSSGRRDKVIEKQHKLKSEGIDPSLIECCDFCDKRDLVQRIHYLPEPFIKDLKDIEKLRNSIAHAASFITSKEELHSFLLTITNTITWIERLENLLVHPEQKTTGNERSQQGTPLCSN